ncbi:MAG: flagellar protein FlaG [Gammaproteobacteria bacterium]|nr:flagellar protein FlaG [Gammaproteobacteria bacterium]MCP5407726.1 flagellar protein FlaG [Chromatiaceae bacterium]MCP5441660.1 flagellar protein FlaG [Chromatiaceae bacterium]
MINEISQNTLGTITSQSRRETGAASKTQSAQAVDLPAAALPRGQGPDAAKAKEAAGSAVNEKQLEEMVDDLNGLAQSVQRQLEFTVDGDNGKVIVMVVDADTKEVIREIPSEEIRNMQKQLREVSEMMFDKGGSTSFLFKGEA